MELWDFYGIKDFYGIMGDDVMFGEEGEILWFSGG